jgi:hypothetical protein
MFIATSIIVLLTKICLLVLKEKKIYCIFKNKEITSTSVKPNAKSSSLRKDTFMKEVNGQIALGFAAIGQYFSSETCTVGGVDFSKKFKI